ncbi:Uncharacterized protein SCF082_LOCUS12009 [Durusdinium trenchii]|uniref:Uncharacterized protein n=1 Tax=Durusdinium trenchii TaxID=1381693 RepID=A0ABP0JGS9_9DINO
MNQSQALNEQKSLLFEWCIVSGATKAELRTYATEKAFASSGAHVLRGWHLPFRSDYGLRGTADEVQRLLSQLMMLNGLATHPDLPGTEKLVVTTVDEKWLKSPRVFVSPKDFDAPKGLLPPETCFMVKGWNRGVCALLCMMAVWELDALDISLGSCSVSGCLTPFGIYTLFGMSHLLPAGVTLTTSSIRRRPNAFNLLHQLEAMQRGGFDNALQNLEALNTTASFAAAYQIGRTEAGAASNLLTAVSESTRDQLKELVRLFGQPRFLLHDGIAAGVFNMTYNGGALSVDESLSLIQVRCGGNSSTLGFALMPQPHSSAAHTAILGSFDVQEISMIFKESAHGGLAITSGSHKHIEWNKSRIMLGAITGIERVQQRGIEASKSIVLKLLDGLQLPEGAPILVVDCMPNRFGEWSQACAQIQLGELLGENKSVRMHYMGILLADDVGTMSSLKSSVAGQLMTKWWDQSQEAGPKRRSRTSFSDPVPALEVLTITNNQCKKLRIN